MRPLLAGNQPIRVQAEPAQSLRLFIQDGWAHLATVGSIITKQHPGFDSRTFGYAKLSDFIAATTLFELDRRVPGDGKPAVVYARNKRRPAQAPPS